MTAPDPASSAAQAPRPAAEPWVGGRSGFPRWLLVLALTLLVLWLLWSLKNALTLVAVSIIVAYIFDPVVDRLEGRRIPRSVGIIALLGLLLVAIVAVAVLIVPRIVAEATSFFSALPAHAEHLWAQVHAWLASYGVDAPRDVSELGALLGGGSADVTGQAASTFGSVASWVAGSTLTLLNAVATLFVVAFLSFYVLNDFDRIRVGALELVPWRHQPWVADLGGELDRVLAHYVRGQLVVMLFLGFAYSAAYAALGVPLGVAIGIAAGMLSIIPYVGGVVALGAALLSCVLGGTSLLQLGGVVLAHSAIQGLEGFVVTPRVMEGQVGVPAFWVVLAMLAFGELFGFVGILLAIPLAAVMKVLIVRGLAAYRRSAWYGVPPPQAPAAPLREPEAL